MTSLFERNHLPIWIKNLSSTSCGHFIFLSPIFEPVWYLSCSEPDSLWQFSFFPLNWGRNCGYNIHKGIDGIFSYRQNPVKYYGNGTPKIPTQVPGKNENCLWLVELLQLRSQIGSKTQDKEIECQKEWGKFSAFLQTITKMRPFYFMSGRGFFLKHSVHNYHKY